MSQTDKDVSTQGGAYIAGNVNTSGGNFIGHDQITYIKQYVLKQKVPSPPIPARPPELTGFVGRQAELAYYTEKLKTNNIIVISGISGVGKTAFAARLATIALNIPPEKILWYRCYPDDSVHTIIWAFAAFLASKGERNVWKTLNRASQSGELPPVNILLDYLFQPLQDQNYLVCFDDFHHLIKDTKRYARLVDKLRQSARNGAIKLLVTSQQAVDLGTEIRKEQLGGLILDDIRLLLTERKVQLDQRQIKKLRELTEGNAQILILAIQALQETDDKSALIDRLVPGTPIQDFLTDLVHAGLKERERNIMRGVSALLDWPGTADAIADIVASKHDIHDSLDYLCNRFLLRAIIRQKTEYAQHNTLQAFYYSRLTRNPRIQLHHRAAVYYERTELDQSRAALHHLCAEEYEQTVRLAIKDVRNQLHAGRATILRRVWEGLPKQQVQKEFWADVCIAKGQTFEFLQEVELAQASYEEALAELAILSESSLVQTRKIEVYRGLGILLRGRKPVEALKWLEQGLPIVTQINQDLEADFLVQIGIVQLRLGHNEPAKESLEGGLQKTSSNPNRLRLLALLNLGYYYYYQNQLVQSSDYMAQALEMAQRLHDPFNELAAYTNLAALKQVTGDWAASDKYSAKAVKLAQELGNLAEESKAKLNAGVLLMRRGKHKAAADQINSTLENVRQANINEIIISCLSYLAELASSQGEIVASLAALTEAKNLAITHQIEYLLPFIYYVQAEVYFVQKNYEQSEAYAQLSIDTARRLGMGQEEGQGLRILGRVQMSTQRLTQAVVGFEESLTFVSQNPYETAHTQVAWGSGLLLHGDPVKGRDLLAHALDTFKRLGAQHDKEVIENLLDERQ